MASQKSLISQKENNIHTDEVTVLGSSLSKLINID